MRLSKSQKEHLLAGISEGLQTDELNKRAARFSPPYEVSRQQVDFYRDSRGVKVKEIVEQMEACALKTGFARKERRVEVLNLLAGAMVRELLDEGKLWLQDVKAVGSGEFTQIVDFETFNAAEVSALRGVLDDIAKEMGERRQKVDVKINEREALAQLLGVRVEDLPAVDSPDAQS